MVLSLWVGGESVLMPSLFAGSQRAVLTMFLPVPLVVATALALDSRVPALEASAVRPVPRFDVALVLATLAAALVLAVAADSGVLICVIRNAAFLTGLFLLTRPLAGQASVMTAVGWIAVVVFFSSRPWPDPDPWTVLPEPADALHAAAAAVASLTAGALVHLHLSRGDR